MKLIQLDGEEFQIGFSWAELTLLQSYVASVCNPKKPEKEQFELETNLGRILDHNQPLSREEIDVAYADYVKAMKT